MVTWLKESAWRKKDSCRLLVSGFWPYSVALGLWWGGTPWWEYVGSNAAHSVAAKKLRVRRERGEKDRDRDSDRDSDSQSEKQIQRGTETETQESRGEGRKKRRERKGGWGGWRGKMESSGEMGWVSILPSQDMILMTELPPPPYLLKVLPHDSTIRQRPSLQQTSGIYLIPRLHH